MFAMISLNCSYDVIAIRFPLGIMRQDTDFSKKIQLGNVFSGNGAIRKKVPLKNEVGKTKRQLRIYTKKTYC